MKKIIKYVMLLSIIVTSFSCDEKEWLQPDVALTPIYALTDISGANAPNAINIYENIALIVEYKSDVLLSSFMSSNYVDSSTETMYEISVDKIIQFQPGDNGVDAITITYKVSADKITGLGTLTEISEDGSELIRNIMISESEVYN